MTFRGATFPGCTHALREAHHRAADHHHHPLHVNHDSHALSALAGSHGLHAGRYYLYSFEYYL